MGPKVGNLSANGIAFASAMYTLQDGVHSQNQSQTKGTHQWNTVAGPGLAPPEALRTLLGP